MGTLGFESQFSHLMGDLEQLNLPASQVFSSTA